MHGSAGLSGSMLLVENSKVQAAKLKNISLIGPSENELDGLSFEEKKRKRNGPEEGVFLLTDGKTVSANPEADLSNMDCSVSSTILLAESARQTSQSL